jgi:hypothetical protein
VSVQASDRASLESAAQRIRAAFVVSKNPPDPPPLVIATITSKGVQKGLPQF